MSVTDKRKQAARAKHLEPWTAGIIPSAARVFAAAMKNAGDDFKRKALLWYLRDPKTGDLPFGVF